MYKRREAREQAFIIIFENMFTNESVSSIVRMAENNRDFKVIPFGKKLAKYAIDNSEQIDEIIKKYTIKWSINRISKVALAILKMAVAEFLFIDNVHYVVSINEAIELAKNYLGEEEVGFINGVLGAIVDDECNKIKNKTCDSK